MRTNRYIIIVFLMVLWGQLVLAQTPEELFKQATESYNAAQYQKAIDQYQGILDLGQESSALYYNLANAHYKLNNVAESIYYYEKALKLNPDNEDAQNNIVFAQQMTVDAITPLPKTWLRGVSDCFISIFSLQVWSILPILGVFVFVMSFLLYYFSQKTIFKRIFFTLMLLALIGSIGTYFIADFHKKSIESQRYAIMFDKATPVFAEPNAYGAEMFSLHEGTKVEVIDYLNDWVKIRLADGKIGWARQTTLRVL
ncbi:tetratricopeptide repeat protein [Capnocytophaga canimorsus]|uniref:tetratricopeptide repeat protein n=1 Tax=Capnocytophaga canimorsus TaxID=28188 RepID=UPI0037CFA61D